MRKRGLQILETALKRIVKEDRTAARRPEQRGDGLSDQLAPVPVADGFHCGKRIPLPKNQSPKRCGSAVPAA